MNKQLRCAGCVCAFTKQAAPVAAAGIGILEALMGGLGVYFAGKDVYEGIQNRSLGQTAWGAAQIPLALAGGSMIHGGPPKAWHDQLTHSAPRLAALPGAKRLGKAVDWAEGAAEGIGGHLFEGAGRMAHHAGLTRTGDWLKNRKSTGKQMLGFLAAQQALGGLSGGGQQQQPGGYSEPGPETTRQPAVWQAPIAQSSAPRADFPTMSGPQ